MGTTIVSLISQTYRQYQYWCGDDRCLIYDRNYFIPESGSARIKNKGYNRFMMTELEKYYNKFNEEKRLKSRHGQVEFITSMKYIHKYLPKREHGQVKILDVGSRNRALQCCACRRRVRCDGGRAGEIQSGNSEKKNSSVKAYQGNALKLSRFPDKEFDLIILFEPMYHLYTKEDKVKALMEAKRVLKDEGTILVAYTMNEYSVLVYGFRENHIQECLENGKLDANYRVCPSPEDLYDYVRLEDIDSYNEAKRNGTDPDYFGGWTIRLYASGVKYDG